MACSSEASEVSEVSVEVGRVSDGREEEEEEEDEEDEEDEEECEASCVSSADGASLADSGIFGGGSSETETLFWVSRGGGRGDKGGGGRGDNGRNETEGAGAEIEEGEGGAEAPESGIGMLGGIELRGEALSRGRETRNGVGDKGGGRKAGILADIRGEIGLLSVNDGGRRTD